MAIARLSFRNPNRGKQPRVAFWHWIPRLVIHKRLAYSRHGVAHALKVAQRELDRFYYLRSLHNVPIEDAAPLPRLPSMPGDDWIFFRRDIGATKPVVTPEPAQQEPQQAGATA